tara:strand:- start:222 stop:746 length:525 start_codon:yes stop_codon:yes gene_type:complete
MKSQISQVEKNLIFVSGIGVLISYYIVFGRWIPGNYLQHPFWFGMDSKVIKMFIVFQVLAVIGFLIAFYYYYYNSVSSGILSYKYGFSGILLLFFISAIIWPFATYFNWGWLVVVSLITTAMATILFLAGAVEDKKGKWYIVLALIFLNITTVLGDAVSWNAHYILHKLNNYIT